MTARPAIALCSLMLLLAACGSDRATRPAATTQAPSQVERTVGNYKIGKPYQISGVWYYPKVDYDYDQTGIASWYGPGFHGKQTANGEVFDQNALTAAHPTLPMPSVVQVTNLENGRSIDLRINDRGPFKNERIIDVSRRAAQLLGFERKGTAKVRVVIREDESRQHAVVAQNKQVAETAPPAVPVESVSAAPLDASTASVSVSTTSAGSGSGAANGEPRRMASIDWPDGTVQREAVRPSNIYIQAGSFLRRDHATRLSLRLSKLARSRVQPTRVGTQSYFRVRLGPLGSVAEADRLMKSLIAAGHADAKIVVQ